MSPFVQSATRIGAERLCVLQKSRKKKVYFPLDLLSFLPIIKVMKGRTCNAAFSDKPGFEKLLTVSPGKRSFLKLVTLRKIQREPFSRVSVAGASQCIPHIGYNLHLFDSGLNTGHCYLLRMTYCGRWPVPFLPFDGKTPYSGRPLFLSNFYTFSSANMPACLCGTGAHAGGHFVSRRYRDINK